MNTERNCRFCKYYKDGYCENLELQPCYPSKGCGDFSKREALEQQPCDKIINTIDFAIDATSGKDNYSVGMRNGMKYVKSLIDGEEPDYDKCEEQQPCEDCISRKKALAEFKRIYFDNETVIRCAELVLGGLPSIQPKAKVGHWTDKYDDVFKYYCSKCNTGSDLRTTYCPNCGAKMVEQQERSDKE